MVRKRGNIFVEEEESDRDAFLCVCLCVSWASDVVSHRRVKGGDGLLVDGSVGGGSYF